MIIVSFLRHLKDNMTLINMVYFCVETVGKLIQIDFNCAVMLLEACINSKISMTLLLHCYDYRYKVVLVTHSLEQRAKIETNEHGMLQSYSLMLQLTRFTEMNLI